MRCPSWDQGPVMYADACSAGPGTQAVSTFTGCQIPPTQWWFWILAGALGVGLMVGGKR